MSVVTKNKMCMVTPRASQACELTNIQLPAAPAAKSGFVSPGLPRPAGQRCSWVTIRTLQRVRSGEYESPVATGIQMSPHIAGWSQEDLVAEMGWQLWLWALLGLDNDSLSAISWPL